MKESVMIDTSNELMLNFLMLTLSAKGSVAGWLAIPVSGLLIALAWRIVRRSGR
jgi:hypothetical protein